MATLILSNVGSAVGGALGGPVGAMLGRAVGAMGGSFIDQSLFGKSQNLSQGRLGDAHLQTSAEGRGIPRVYGRTRISGEIIWATRFEEEITKEKQGGKSAAPSSTIENHRYYANMALALCEGPISGIGRIWADGKELDQEKVGVRFYKGDYAQLPDPLIEAVQGSAPAYRGTAYLVFERFPVGAYGNRIPQFSVEVIRSIEPLEKMIRAVTIIPGAGEFAYASEEVLATNQRGTTTINRHQFAAGSDWSRSLDELQALCPNLESVALVVSWFGDDLRCGHCTIKPKVVAASKQTIPLEWSVAGINRSQAEVVSYIEGKAAYGGTPSDISVQQAIADLKSRGLKVMLYPFLLMDIAPNNGLPDPYGGTEQSAFPWRGEITSALHRSQAGSSNGTAAAGSEVGSFVGNGARWDYRRLILHYAQLAKDVGGVDAFLIGTELVGLTTIQDDTGNFPFVSALCQIAQDVKAILPTCQLSYAADWTEYAGFKPADGELRFPLDPLWAEDAIDFVGIDNYLPLSDSRPDDDPATLYDVTELQKGIAGGEYFDWYYASHSDRQNKTRAPITDGAYGKPWVFRQKDLVSWWQNQHYERRGGVEDTLATAWVPQSKPIWFTELGFPAVSHAGNQPNTFYDPKSSQSRFPWFSNGQRDDLIQRRSLEATLSHWGEAHSEGDAGPNPVSPLYGGPMIASSNIFVWTWDARPFPAFPSATEVWGDAENWQFGHWLQGRLGSCSVKGLIGQLATDFDIPLDRLKLGEVTGHVDGFVIARPSSFREAVESIAPVYGLLVADQGEHIRFLSPAITANTPIAMSIGLGQVVEDKNSEGPVRLLRQEDGALPCELRLDAFDPLADFAPYSISSRNTQTQSGRTATLSPSLCLSKNTASTLLGARLQQLWQARERAFFSLAGTNATLQVGDVVHLQEDVMPNGAAGGDFRIVEMESGDVLSIEAERLDALAITQMIQTASQTSRSTAQQTQRVGPPEVVIANLPAFRESIAQSGAPVIAVASQPWAGRVDVFMVGASQSLTLVASCDKPALMGTLKADLPSGPVWRWDEGTHFDVEIAQGSLESLSKEEVLAGGNLCAVGTDENGYEVLQFRNAELIGESTYRLSGLLRGQLGTEGHASTAHQAGSRFLMLNDALVDLPLPLDALDLPVTLKAVPSGFGVDSLQAVSRTHTLNALALKPIAPVHIKAVRLSNDDIHFVWKRRTRFGGDSWALADVPLHETEEQYRLKLGLGAQPVRVFEPRETGALYTRQQQLDDFGALAHAFDVHLCQLSPVLGEGIIYHHTINIL
ncbi:hypothetical protein E1162_07340 [Rhodobacteraceae bacterium RKSG542]|uniref:baseplate multidomain protein megatron n=1 Tax=Pseudovibrio flavus TaxID=2529854 RepID=UPI0012BCD485|nr:glycoside hydrolase/phage tail family protein [Pseudovibrio flavus]MTI17051.1 hypothetical protein [Pseudovibrio flavus]